MDWARNWKDGGSKGFTILLTMDVFSSGWRPTRTGRLRHSWSTYLRTCLATSTANGQLDVLDIDELSVVVREGNHPKRFDLTDDDLVTDDDRVAWVHQLKNTYFGDANLNGDFNTGDFTHVFTAGKYETGKKAGWDEGDWNGDDIFGTGDFVTAFIDGGYELGPKQDVAPVPEPASTLLFVIGLFGIATFRRPPQP